MNTITYLKSVLAVGVFVGAVFLLRNQLFLPQDNQLATNTTRSNDGFGWKIPVAQFQSGGQVSNIDAYSDIRDPGGIPRGLPVRLKIPSIGVDTAIEDAYITSDGRMDVPAGSINVAWYALGPLPGQTGSAVIGGHFGIDDGVPKVFYNLNKLREGDKVYVVDDNGETLAFVVRSIRLFDRNADSTPVFTSNDNLAHLNIITCEGVWNKVDDSYPDRRVVFTDAIPSEGAVVVDAPQVAITKPDPPAAILTTATPAVLVTPTVALPDDGILPTQIISPSPSVIGPYLTSLYGNPTDGVISSTLFISIIFTAIKILKHLT